MLSIGEFSKLCMVTTKTLRHYDLMGLLKPKELNGENGYRYYSVDQLGVMEKILRLKSYGFSLGDIKALLDGGNDSLCNAMKNQLLSLQLLAEQERSRILRLKKDIEDIQKGDFMKQQFEITLIETAPVNIASIRETIAIKDFQTIMQKLFACGLPCEGAPLTIYHSPDFNPDATDVEVGFPTSVKSDKTRTLEGGLCAKGVHCGEYAALHESYMAMGKWIEDNGYQVAGPPYEKYVNDPETTPGQDLITEIYFPVRK